MPELLPEEIIQRGHAARSLLSSDIFNGVCDDLLKLYALNWLATGEFETKEREALHANARAVAAVRGELQARVSAADKMQADFDRAERRKKEI